MPSYITHTCNVGSDFRDAQPHGGLTLDVDVEYPAKPEHLVRTTGSSPLGRRERRSDVPNYGTLSTDKLMFSHYKSMPPSSLQRC